MHGVEELAEPPYLYGPPVAYTIIRASGERTVRPCRPHGFNGVEQRYDRVAGLLEPLGALRRGKVLAADCLLLNAAPLWEQAAAALQRDPLFFVERR